MSNRTGFLVPRRGALALLAAAAATAPAFGQTPRIRIGAATTESYSEPFFGLDSGIFARAGLDVEILAFSNAGQIVQAAAAGAVDVGLADMIQIAHAVNHGLPYGFFAGGSLYSTDAPTTILCVAKNGTVQTAKDLEGQTVGVVALTSISSLAVQEWLRRNGADPSLVHLFEMPSPTMAPAVTRGTVSAAFISEPMLSSAKADVRWLGKAYDAIAKHFYISAWFASRDWIAKSPAVASRLQQAVYATARWANTHHDGSAPILAKYSKIELESIRSMTRATFATSLDPRMMQPVLDLAARYQLIEKPVDARNLILQV